jgi:hypothetical protein
MRRVSPYLCRSLVTAAAALLVALAFQLPVRAQAPDLDRVVYTNTCMFEESGDTWGEGVILTRSAAGYSFEFIDFTSTPHPPVPIKGQISGNEILFEFQIGDLPVRFAGTITPNEIKGRYANDRNISFYNTAKVLLERIVPGQMRGHCPSSGWRSD